MIKPLPKTKVIARSPLRTACRSALRALQGKPSVYYTATWDNDDWPNWKAGGGRMFYDGPQSCWFAWLIPTTSTSIPLTYEEEGGELDFDIIDEPAFGDPTEGAVVETRTLTVEPRTWFLRTKYYKVFGSSSVLWVDRWYFHSDGWTPSGVYELFLDASPALVPGEPPGGVGRIDPVTLKPRTSF